MVFFFEPTQRPRPSFNQKDKEYLYGEQKGKCNGCEEKFPIRNVTVDHIRPFSNGGSDKPSNLQLDEGKWYSSPTEETSSSEEHYQAAHGSEKDAHGQKDCGQIHKEEGDADAKGRRHICWVLRLTLGVLFGNYLLDFARVIIAPYNFHSKNSPSFFS